MSRTRNSLNEVLCASAKDCGNGSRCGTDLITLGRSTKGCLRFRITLWGKDAHSSKPYLGVNAIPQMARVISVLEDDAASLASTAHTLLGAATFNIGTLRGGTQVNVVPESCEIDVDRRLLPGEEARDVLQRYTYLIRHIPDLRGKCSR